MNCDHRQRPPTRNTQQKVRVVVRRIKRAPRRRPYTAACLAMPTREYIRREQK